MHKIGKQILASILTVSMILQPTIISYADEAITKTTESENGSVEMNLEQTVKLVDEEKPKDSESSVSNNTEKTQKDLKDEESQEIKEDSESNEINETATKKETEEKSESENTNQENQENAETTSTQDR